MKNQLVILLLCSIAVYLVSGEDDQKSNVAKLNSLIRKTRDKLSKLKFPSLPNPNLQFKGRQTGRIVRPNFRRSFLIFNKTLRDVIKEYGVTFLTQQLRGAKVDLKKTNHQYGRKGGQPGPRPGPCFIRLEYKYIFRCYGRCSFHWVLVKTVRC